MKTNVWFARLSDGKRTWEMQFDAPSGAGDAGVLSAARHEVLMLNQRNNSLRARLERYAEGAPEYAPAEVEAIAVGERDGAGCWVPEIEWTTAKEVDAVADADAAHADYLYDRDGEDEYPVTFSDVGVTP